MQIFEFHNANSIDANTSFVIANSLTDAENLAKKLFKSSEYAVKKILEPCAYSVGDTNEIAKSISMGPQSPNLKLFITSDAKQHCYLNYKDKDDIIPDDDVDSKTLQINGDCLISKLNRPDTNILISNIDLVIANDLDEAKTIYSQYNDISTVSFIEIDEICAVMSVCNSFLIINEDNLNAICTIEPDTSISSMTLFQIINHTYSPDPHSFVVSDTIDHAVDKYNAIAIDKVTMYDLKPIYENTVININDGAFGVSSVSASKDAKPYAYTACRMICTDNNDSTNDVYAWENSALSKVPNWKSIEILEADLATAGNANEALDACIEYSQDAFMLNNGLFTPDSFVAQQAKIWIPNMYLTHSMLSIDEDCAIIVNDCSITIEKL